MSAVAQPQLQVGQHLQVSHHLQDVGQQPTAQESFSFGIAGYKDGVSMYNTETVTPERTNIQAAQTPPGKYIQILISVTLVKVVLHEFTHK